VVEEGGVLVAWRGNVLEVDEFRAVCRDGELVDYFC
jgi:hypothetical protein